MKVVERTFPFQSTVEFEVKLLPLTVRVNAGVPAVAVEGASELTPGAGAGGMITAGVVTVVRAPLLPPPQAEQKKVETTERRAKTRVICFKERCDTLRPPGKMQVPKQLCTIQIIAGQSKAE